MSKYKSQKYGIYSIAGAGTLVAITLFLGLTIISLFTRADPGEFFLSLTSKFVIDALVLSLVTSTITTLIVIILGTPAAYYHSHTNYRGKSLVETLIDLPLVLPPAVAGFALLLFLGRNGLIGKYLHILGIDIAFTTLAVIIAQFFVSSPFYLRQARGLFSQLDPKYELTARTLGATPGYVLLTIVLPLTRTGLISGAIMTFARAIGEFGATIMFAGNLPGVTQTMPLAIYSAMQGDFNSAITLSIILLFTSFIIMGFTRIISDKRDENV